MRLWECSLGVTAATDAQKRCEWCTDDSMPCHMIGKAENALKLLPDLAVHLRSVRVFLTTREKMHPCGVQIHDELQSSIAAILSPKTPGQPAEGHSDG